MPVWLGVLILAAVVALTVAVVWHGRQFGQFTERNTRESRAAVTEFCTRMEEAVREINASTALLHASLNDSLVTIARMRKEDKTQPHEAAHTSEEEVA